MEHDDPISPTSSDDNLLENATELNSLTQQVAMHFLQHSEPEPQLPATRRVFKRRREDAFQNLWSMYFAPHPECPEDGFRRRYRMHKHVFLRIVNAFSEAYLCFQQRADACGRLGLHPLQKCTTAMRMLAYGCPADIIDESMRLAESTVMECLENFTEGVIEQFGAKYLRKPNAEDIQRLLNVGQARGFPGMLGSIDCMHWEWLMCPTAWEGQYHRGDHNAPTIILEAVASYDTWIWHAFFGTPGTCNDINVLDRSPLFDDLHNGTAPEVNFTVNGREYTTGYYLADGIYPQYPTFVKSIRYPQLPKDRKFSKLQESCRKDVECAFGILKKRFNIIKCPARGWSPRKIENIMQCCVILHNMIVEDECDGYSRSHDYDHVHPLRTTLTPREYVAFQQFVENRVRSRDKNTHIQLQKDLIEHVWNS